MNAGLIWLLCLLIQATRADLQFQNRPDLAPPRLNITIRATSDVEEGFLFVAPLAGLPDTQHEQHGPREAAPYIFRDNGISSGRVIANTASGRPTSRRCCGRAGMCLPVLKAVTIHITGTVMAT